MKSGYIDNDDGLPHRFDYIVLRSCRFKRDHATEADALQELVRFTSLPSFNPKRGTLDVYKCRYYNHWHIGNSKKTEGNG